MRHMRQGKRMLQVLKTLRRYPLVVGAIGSGVVFFTFRAYFDLDLFETLIDGLSRIEHVEADEVFFFIIVAIIGLALDQTRNVGRQRAKNSLHTSRIQAVRSTMAAVHDIVNNALNNLLLIRLEAEKSQALSPETLALFENLIEDTAVKLREIDELETLAERTLAPGLVRLEVKPNLPPEKGDA